MIMGTEVWKHQYMNKRVYFRWITGILLDVFYFIHCFLYRTNIFIGRVAENNLIILKDLLYHER